MLAPGQPSCLPLASHICTLFQLKSNRLLLARQPRGPCNTPLPLYETLKALPVSPCCPGGRKLALLGFVPPRAPAPVVVATPGHVAVRGHRAANSGQPRGGISQGQRATLHNTLRHSELVLRSLHCVLGIMVVLHARTLILPCPFTSQALPSMLHALRTRAVPKPSLTQTPHAHQDVRELKNFRGLLAEQRGSVQAAFQRAGASTDAPWKHMTVHIYFHHRAGDRDERTLIERWYVPTDIYPHGLG